MEVSANFVRLRRRGLIGGGELGGVICWACWSVVYWCCVCAAALSPPLVPALVKEDHGVGDVLSAGSDVLFAVVKGISQEWEGACDVRGVA